MRFMPVMVRSSPGFAAKRDGQGSCTEPKDEKSCWVKESRAVIAMARLATRAHTGCNESMVLGAPLPIPM